MGKWALTDEDQLKVTITRSIIDHLVTTGSDLGRHKDDVARVQRKVLRGLRK